MKLRLEDAIDAFVERAFHQAEQNPPRYGEQCRNPVTLGSYVGQADPLDQQKREARQVLIARALFAVYGPHDLQPFPLNCEEQEELKRSGHPAKRILAWYARSLVGRKYNLEEHPSFHDYACGVMASELAPDFIRNDVELQRRFPRRILKGLGPGLCWSPPEEWSD
jgi:hypothetical protein